MGDNHGPNGSLDRLSERLQDALPVVHGVPLVGFSPTLGQGSHLPGVPGHAILNRLCHTSLQLRGHSELQRRPGLATDPLFYALFSPKFTH